MTLDKGKAGATVYATDIPDRMSKRLHKASKNRDPLKIAEAYNNYVRVEFPTGKRTGDLLARRFSACPFTR